MTLRPSARCSAGRHVWRGIERNKNWCHPGRGWMSKRGVALVAGRVRKKSSEKSAANRMFGSAAIACVVIGCGFTVYNNIIAANVYPTLAAAGYDEPVVRR